MESSLLDRRQLLSYAAFSSVTATAITGNASDGKPTATTANGGVIDRPRPTDRAPSDAE